VRTDLLSTERSRYRCGTQNGALDQAVNAEASDGLPIAVEKQALLRPALGGYQTQLFHSGGPQKKSALQTLADHW
jgi:hypothetical protein